MGLADWVRLACYFFLIIVGYRIAFLMWPYRSRPSGFILAFYGVSVLLGGIGGTASAILGDGISGQYILTGIIVAISVVTYMVYRYLMQADLPKKGD